MPYAIRPLSVLSCLSVCDVGVLWPNAWMDQDKTWRAGRPLPWPHCVRWRPSFLSPKGAQPSPIFGPYLLCQIAGWIKMPLGMDVGLGLGDFVLHGAQFSLPKRGRSRPQNVFGPYVLWPNGWMDEDGTSHGGRPQPRRLCVRWIPSHPSPKRVRSPLPNFRPISIVAK